MSTSTSSIDVDPEGPTAQGINDILRTLGHATIPLPLPAVTVSLPSDDFSGWSVPELHSEIRRLRAEIWRLNPGFFTSLLNHPGLDGAVVGDEEGEGDGGEGDVHGAEAVVRAIRNLQSNEALSNATVDLGGSVGEVSLPLTKLPRVRSNGSGQSRKRRRVTLDRDVETGKRLEKTRKTELSKILRARMRAAMSISENDPLPDPLETEDGQVIIPDWLNSGDERALSWVDNISTEVYNEAMAGGQAFIPAEDVDFELIKGTARTAFHNFARKYIVENDPQKAEKKTKHAKGRRRWARKDLKQKRRIKASQDPSFAESIPAGALQLDYMSSEYSSLGEDTDGEDGDGDETTKQEISEERRAEWDAKTLAPPMDPDADGNTTKGWADGLGAKWLEVRTPRWRSDQLNALYTRLDSIAAARTSQRLNPTLVDTAGGIRPGHVAPSHHRFTLSPSLQRRGAKKRDNQASSGNSGEAGTADESWMWKSGIVGVWPALPTKISTEELVEVEGVISGENLWEGYPTL